MTKLVDDTCVFDQSNDEDLFVSYVRNRQYFAARVCRVRTKSYLMNATMSCNSA